MTLNLTLTLTWPWSADCWFFTSATTKDDLEPHSDLDLTLISWLLITEYSNLKGWHWPDLDQLTVDSLLQQPRTMTLNLTLTLTWPWSADCWFFTSATPKDDLEAHCDLDLTLISWLLIVYFSNPEGWPWSSVWPWPELDQLTVDVGQHEPQLLSGDVSGLLPVEHSEGLANLLLGVVAVNLLGHHVEELGEVHRAAACTVSTPRRVVIVKFYFNSSGRSINEHYSCQSHKPLHSQSRIQPIHTTFIALKPWYFGPSATSWVTL